MYQLDWWINGEADCRQRLHAAAQANDLILIEGVMGLFDGTPSAADLAQRSDAAMAVATVSPRSLMASMVKVSGRAAAVSRGGVIGAILHGR